MKKKVLAMLLTSTLFVSLLAGCGSKNSGNSDGGKASETGEMVSEELVSEESASEEITGKITVWEHVYSFEDSLKEIIDGFEKKYPNVEVEYEIKDGETYYALLQTAVQAGEGPDLFWTNGTSTTQLGNFVDNGVCEDLSDKIDFKDITESAMELVTIDEKSWAVPWLTMDTRTCFYNKELFAENGWEIPKTFSEFESLLAKIKDSGTIPISLSVAPWEMLFMYEPLLAGFDAKYTEGLSDYSVKATDQPARDCMQKMVDWGKAGYYGENWLGVDGLDSQVLAFTTGKAAMLINGSWDAALISSNNPDLNFGAFAIPAEDGKTGLVGTPACGFSVNAASKNIEAATAFANYCASLEAQTIWVQTQGAVSASMDIEASSDIAKEISESGKGNTYRSWQNVLASYSTTGQASSVWEAGFPKIFTGELTVDELMDQIAAEMK